MSITETYRLYSQNRKLEAEIIKLKSQLNTATELLHDCLEWDNGGERDYEAIVAFVNEQLL